MKIELDGYEVKMGDRLWTILWGWQDVRGVVEQSMREYPIILGNSFTLTAKGEHIKGGPRVAFWDEVKIIPPPKPRKMVKKTAWVNVYPNGMKFVYNTREAADRAVHTNRIACVETAPWEEPE